jgi:predicted lysophospholipase L1 biosynthesis ABC-type transport system permease subunit
MMVRMQPRGSQSLVLGSLYRTTMGLTLNSSLLLELQPFPWHFAHLRPLAFLDGIGTFWMSPHPTADRQDALVSFASMARLVREETGSYWRGSDLPIRFVLFKLREGLTDAELDEALALLRTLEHHHGNCQMQDVRNRYRALQTAKELLHLFSGGVTGLALVICFFSLISSMVANIHEQAKEIGILRALGTTAAWIARVYTLEAMVLVLTAAALGLGIGTFVAFTVTAQRALFTQLPLPFAVPVVPMLIISLASILSAVLAAYVPASRLLRRNIVRLLRGS